MSFYHSIRRGKVKANLPPHDFGRVIHAFVTNHWDYCQSLIVNSCRQLFRIWLPAVWQDTNGVIIPHPFLPPYTGFPSPSGSRSKFCYWFLKVWMVWHHLICCIQALQPERRGQRTGCSRRFIDPDSKTEAMEPFWWRPLRCGTVDIRAAQTFEWFTILQKTHL